MHKYGVELNQKFTWWVVWGGGVGSYSLLSQAPTPVEVELGCDNLISRTMDCRAPVNRQQLRLLPDVCNYIAVRFPLWYLFRFHSPQSILKPIAIKVVSKWSLGIYFYKNDCFNDESPSKFKLMNNVLNRKWSWNIYKNVFTLIKINIHNL